MPETTVPELRDAEIRLRALQEDDAPRIVEYAVDRRTRASVSGLPHPYRTSDALAHITRQRTRLAEGLGIVWAIEVDGVFMGAISVAREQPWSTAVGEIGYIVHPEARGRRLATRAMHLVVAHAFDTWGLQALRWRAAASNLASRRVAWANGFVIDGRQRDGHPNTDGTLDDCVFGRLGRDDPREPAHPWWEPVVLEGNGIRLRPWRDTDAPAEAPEPSTERFLVSADMVPQPDGYASWLLEQNARMAAGHGVYWCIADLETDHVLGGIQIDGLGHPATRGTGSLGYWLSPTARGRGLLQAALDAAIDHAFTPRDDLAGRSGLGLDRLWAGTDARNRASQRALRRAGFLEVLTERRVLTSDGDEPADAVSFELLATDDRTQQRVEPAPATVLETARLRLRPWTHDDTPQEGPDAAALQNMPARAMPTPDTWDSWLSRRHRLRDTGTHDFCIADRETDRPLGDISIFGIDRTVGQGELGYWLYPSARGQGYADEAVAEIVRHAFTPVEDGGAGLNRLQAETNLDNYASRGVLLRTGFRHWGDDHEAYVLGDSGPLDGAYYELLHAWHGRPSPAITIPTLDGDHVRLRPWRMSDAPRIVEACSDPTTRHWLSGLPHPYDEAVAQGYVHSTRESAATGESVTWCVADLESGQALGSLELAALRGPRPDTASVGYWAHPDARGRGAMSEALRVAIEYAFTAREEGGIGRRRLVLIAARDNHASQAVARSRGFRRTGVEHEAERLGDGTVTDMVRFELLRDAPTGLPPRLSTSDVRLRPLELSDASSIREAWADPDTRHWIGDVPEPTDDAARRWVRDHRVVDTSGHGMCFTICRADADAPCGVLRLLHLADGPAAGAEIGYWSHPSVRGEGLTTAALLAACTFAFTPAAEGGLGLTRISLGIADGNAASAAVARACGFEQVGRDRRAETLGDGTVVDLLRFDRLRDDPS